MNNTHKEVIHKDDIDKLLSLYNQEHRYYHNLEHIKNMFNYVDTYSSYEDNVEHLVYIAIWFHDAIYDPTKTNNEDESVTLFMRSHTYQTLTIKEQKIVSDMIYATKAHHISYEHIKHFDKKYQQAIKDFLDADLWELRKSNLQMRRTIEIEMSIFKEYSFVPFKIYQEKRIEILKTLKDTLGLKVKDNINFIKSFVPKIGLYCGTFNPIHKGHYDIIKRSDKIFDKTIIAKGINPNKNNDNFSNETEELKKILPYHEVVSFKGFQYDLIERLIKDGYKVVLIKGLRNATDFTYEKHNNLLNNKIGVRNKLEVETTFLIADSKFEAYRSSDIKMLLNSSKKEVGYSMLHNPQK